MSVSRKDRGTWVVGDMEILDALTVGGSFTITGSIVIAGDFEIGISGTGSDLKAWGDTAGYYMLWDASASTNGGLIVIGTTDLTGNLTVDGTLVSIDGATSVRGISAGFTSLESPANRLGVNATIYMQVATAATTGITTITHTGTTPTVTWTADSFSFGGPIYGTAVPTADHTPTIGIGNYDTPLVDASLVDSLFLQSVVTATAKTAGGSSTCAGYFAADNAAATANARLQSVLAHTYAEYNCHDAWGVQGTVTIGAGGVELGAVGYNAAGVAGKMTLTGALTVGKCAGGLFIIEGAGAVTEAVSIIEACVENLSTADYGLNLTGSGTLGVGINIPTCTTAIAIADDAPIVLGTTTATAATVVTMELDAGGSGVGSLQMGTSSVAQALNANPGSVVIPISLNVQHAGTDGDMDNYIGFYDKFEILGVGDSGLTAVGYASRMYVGKTGGANDSVIDEMYGSQPWVKHEGVGAITAMSALSAKCDVSADNFTASTANAGHFHIEGAATVTGQFDGVMIEVYPDVTCLDSGLKIAVNSGAVVESGIKLSGTLGRDLMLSSGAYIMTGTAGPNGSVTGVDGSIYIRTGTSTANTTLYICTGTTNWSALETG